MSKNEYVLELTHLDGCKVQGKLISANDDRLVPCTSFQEGFFYRGRIDAVCAFFVEWFLNDDLFESGDRLYLSQPKYRVGQFLIAHK